MDQIRIGNSASKVFARVLMLFALAAAALPAEAAPQSSELIPRVTQKESDQLVAAMQAKQLPVTYALFADEGHGFARPQNRISFYAVSEAFLARCLGGRHEPVGEDFRGSSIEVKAGADHLPGLAQALAAKR